MVYKTFRVNSNKISVNNSYSVKEELKDLIPFSKFEGHYLGKVDGLEDTIGVFLTPVIYFPSSSKDQISLFKDSDGVPVMAETGNPLLVLLISMVLILVSPKRNK